MINDMKYTYEFLRKCHGLRFKATLNNKPQEGIIKVMRDCVMLCYGDEDYGRLSTFERRDTLSFSEATFRILPSDFEIVPRDPETYKDWQVGDKIIRNDRVNVVIFRCGEVVLYKDHNNRCSACPYTCEELSDRGYRLVLTDIEKQILEERKKEEWKPQDGDICYLEARSKWVFIKNGGSDRTDAYASFNIVSGACRLNSIVSDSNLITKLRPATDFEKSILFFALENEKGKRWNADEKRIEDISVPYELKEGDLVLARIDRGGEWKLRVFKGRVDGSERQFKASFDGFSFIYQYGIPYNEETKHLLGTTGYYEEGER